MPIFSNIDDVGRWMADAVRDVGFDIEDEGHGTLGMACAEAVAEGIQAMSAEGIAPDGEDWPENEPDYNNWKAAHFDGERRTNYRTRQMLSRDSLLGEVEVAHDKVTIRYGQGVPSPDEVRGDPTTDTEKAGYAHEQGREFFGLSDATDDRIFETVAGGVARHIQRKGDES